MEKYPQVQVSPIHPTGFRVNSPANRRQQQHPLASSEFISRAEFDQFTQELRQIARSNSEVEAESSDDNRRKDIVRDNIDICEKKFDFTLGGILQKTNKEVLQAVLLLSAQTAYFKQHICNDKGEFKSKLRRKQFESACRGRYNTLKTAMIKSQRDFNVIQEEKVAKRVTARVYRKWLKRAEIFGSFKDIITQEVDAPVDECKAFIITECMSDEEDDELYEGSDAAASFKVLTPSWRSDKLNKLFKIVDRIASENNTHQTESKRRIIILSQ
ncbi:hypothetical protein BD770DRAFT_417111 [Pilaira anomala]|nr:hypothetical protein BD770DRAFT_417111 [Pilaira anomala]